ncbi:hypothetical protein EDEG_03791 [Edhazardia aedis USNM 41457]|uniref:Uncharacterized protein n=1 Tax=Edhazardia aedis (strain USNM 41457) TaxID=1003232 RepID=J9D255_EDHAE|nr:hypothetical protein EDEG_03791 [Edhazardia aedis USNM 41457]|eukprot:EJW01659.1 hypothetical protein EDEG_03791 [Edhazardia aedis USNM 41457]
MKNVNLSSKKKKDKEDSIKSESEVKEEKKAKDNFTKGKNNMSLEISGIETNQNVNINEIGKENVENFNETKENNENLEKKREEDFFIAKSSEKDEIENKKCVEFSINESVSSLAVSDYEDEIELTKKLQKKSSHDDLISISEGALEDAYCRNNSEKIQTVGFSCGNEESAFEHETSKNSCEVKSINSTGNKAKENTMKSVKKEKEISCLESSTNNKQFLEKQEKNSIASSLFENSNENKEDAHEKEIKKSDIKLDNSYNDLVISEKKFASYEIKDKEDKKMSILENFSKNEDKNNPKLKESDKDSANLKSCREKHENKIFGETNEKNSDIVNKINYHLKYDDKDEKNIDCSLEILKEIKSEHEKAQKEIETPSTNSFILETQRKLSKEISLSIKPKEDDNILSENDSTTKPDSFINLSSQTSRESSFSSDENTIQQFEDIEIVNNSDNSIVNNNRSSSDVNISEGNIPNAVFSDKRNSFSLDSLQLHTSKGPIFGSDFLDSLGSKDFPKLGCKGNLSSESIFDKKDNNKFVFSTDLKINKEDNTNRADMDLFKNLSINNKVIKNFSKDEEKNDLLKINEYPKSSNNSEWFKNTQSDLQKDIKKTYNNVFNNMNKSDNLQLSNNEKNSSEKNNLFFSQNSINKLQSKNKYQLEFDQIVKDLDEEIVQITQDFDNLLNDQIANNENIEMLDVKDCGDLIKAFEIVYLKMKDLETNKMESEMEYKLYAIKKLIRQIEVPDYSEEIDYIDNYLYSNLSMGIRLPYKHKRGIVINNKINAKKCKTENLLDIFERIKINVENECIKTNNTDTNTRIDSYSKQFSDILEDKNRNHISDSKNNLVKTDNSNNLLLNYAYNKYLNALDININDVQKSFASFCNSAVFDVNNANEIYTNNNDIKCNKDVKVETCNFNTHETTKLGSFGVEDLKINNNNNNFQSFDKFGIQDSTIIHNEVNNKSNNPKIQSNLSETVNFIKTKLDDSTLKPEINLIDSNNCFKSDEKQSNFVGSSKTQNTEIKNVQNLTHQPFNTSNISNQLQKPKQYNQNNFNEITQQPQELNPFKTIPSQNSYLTNDSASNNPFQQNMPTISDQNSSNFLYKKTTDLPYTSFFGGQNSASSDIFNNIRFNVPGNSDNQQQENTTNSQNDGANSTGSAFSNLANRKRFF